jgi:hypothetical protein
LHRLPYHPYQVVVQSVQVCSVPQFGGEGFEDLRGIVLPAVEAPIHERLHPRTQRAEEGCYGKGGCHDEEIEGAVGYATGSFRDVLDLVPDFSVLTLTKGPEGDTKAVLVLGDEREPRIFRRGVQGKGSLEGLLWEVALSIRSRSRVMRREHFLQG